MKRFFTYITLFTLLSSFAFFASIDDVVAGLRSGNTSQIAKYFDNTVEITMPGKSNSYSKGQAEMVLKDFFAINAVKAFEVVHKGENGGSQYCIGTLTTKNGMYRTTVYMKQKGDKQLLQEITFEKK